MLVGWVEVLGLRNLPHTPFISEHVRCRAAHAHASASVINLTQRNALISFPVPLLSATYSPTLSHFPLDSSFWTLCSLFALLLIALSLSYSTLPTQILFGEEYYACDECECVHRIYIYIYIYCLPLCVWISSYPLIRMTVSINSLGLMCKSVTLAFLWARSLCSLVTPGPNYRADDLTSDH